MSYPFHFNDQTNANSGSNNYGFSSTHIFFFLDIWMLELGLFFCCNRHFSPPIFYLFFRPFSQINLASSTSSSFISTPFHNPRREIFFLFFSFRISISTFSPSSKSIFSNG